MIGTQRTHRRIEHTHGTAILTTASTSGFDTQTGCSAVLLAPHTVGVCRSDLREIRGERFGRRDFGHEIVGTVLDTSSDLGHLREQTIIFDPHPRLSTRSSGFAELVELTGDATELQAALVPVPGGLDPEAAVFGEPLACAVHCVHRLLRASIDVEPDSPVAVVGAGMAGILISAALVGRGYRGALFNVGPERITFLNDRKALPTASAQIYNGHATFSRVILATAFASPRYLDACVRLLADRGVLVLFAGTEPGAHFGDVDIDELRRHELTHQLSTAGKDFTVVGTYGATRADFTDALALLTAAPNAAGWSPALCVQRLITHRLTLTDAASFLTASAANGVLGKAIVEIDTRSRS
ncbi:hypothetical protein ACFYV7_15110 [Nocardia suismassiliense]|uniref:Threonine dehydrogenase or related Zn-dependent dehydrogenase n=1 Tax=Nocardia suismassiliense TaxID=2077092 RepID=A0ABW6QU25_9NOCA